MAIFKQVSGKNDILNYNQTIITYIFEGYKTDDKKWCGAMGCSVQDPVRDFSSIKKAFHKSDGKQGEHFVLSLEGNNRCSYAECLKIAYEIAEYFTGFEDGYQVVFAVHKDTYNRHIHFIVNSVSFRTGKRFSHGPDDLHKLKNYCNRILSRYGFDIIRLSNTDIYDSTLYRLQDGLGFLETPVANTPKLEPEVSPVIPDDEFDDYELETYDLSDYDDAEDEYEEYEDKPKKKHKKSKSKEDKKMGKKSKKNQTSIAMLNDFSEICETEWFDGDYDIIAIDNSKECNIEVKSPGHAAYVAKDFLATSFDDDETFDKIITSNDGDRPKRVIINNKKRLNISIKDNTDDDRKDIIEVDCT